MSEQRVTRLVFGGEEYPVGSEASGTITITENGTGIDVSSYATADVNVSGGGSISLGNVNFVIADDATVKAGDEISGGDAVISVSIGDQIVAGVGSDYSRIPKVAAGANVVAAFAPYDPNENPQLLARKCVVDWDTHTYTSIGSSVDVDATISTVQSDSDEWLAAAFVMPDLEVGTSLLLSAQVVD